VAPIAVARVTAQDRNAVIGRFWRSHGILIEPERGMSWKQDVTETLTGICRFCVRAGVLIDLILLSVFSVWFVGKALYYSLGYLNRVLFSSPW
jgi:hypothetical protein